MDASFCSLLLPDNPYLEETVMALPNYKVLVPHRPFHTEPQMAAFVQEVLQMETTLLVDPFNLELSLVYLTVIQMLRSACDVNQLRLLLHLHKTLAEVVVAADWPPIQNSYRQIASRYQTLMDLLPGPQSPSMKD
jgi:hypothetical protein